MTRRPAFTRADLLALLTLGALLAGCLLPAVAQVRDADARRASINNLKQIALAIHNYNDAWQGKLPPLVDIGGMPNSPTGGGLQNLFFNVLPYIEQDNVYRLFNRATPATYYRAAGNPPGAASTIIKTFISPADSTAPNGTTQAIVVTVNPAPPAPFQASFTGTYATTSYAANGLIPWNTGGIPRTFVDGTANTILFGERAQVCKPGEGNPVHNLWALGVYAPSTPAFALVAPRGQAATGMASPALPLPAKWSKDPVKVRVGRADAEPQDPPEAAPFQIGPGRDGKACDPRLPSTPHAEGMLVALADGSVRTISPKISQWTFWAACTPNGNETLHADW